VIGPPARHVADLTLAWRLLGNPAVAVPAGSTVDGLPAGVRVAAAPWWEELAPAAAAVIEAATRE